MTSHFLSINQAAARLGVSAKTLRRWEKQGLITPLRTNGNQRRYALSDIEKLEKQTLTINQAAARLGVSHETLRRWERDGKISASRTAGNQRRFDADQLERLQLEHLQAEAEGSVVVHYEPTGAGLKIAPKSQAGEPVNQTATGFYWLKSPVFISFFAVLSLVLVGGAWIFVNNKNYIPQEKINKVLSLARLGNETKENKAESVDQEVLQAATQKKDFALRINVPTEILSTASVAGKLTAPNILYSIIAGQNISITGDLQNPTISASAGGVLSLGGQTGDLNLTAGSGITIDGLTITNSDPGSAIDAFAKVKVGSTTISAGSSSDTLELSAGSGISLSADSGNKKVTISSSQATGVITIKEGGTTLTTSANTLDFLGGDFDLTESPAGEVNVNLASMLTSVSSVAGSFNVGTHLSVVGTTTFNNLTYTWPGTQTNNYILQTNGSGTLSWIDPGTLPNSDKWDSTNGAIYPKNASVLDLLIGGTTSSSAKFAVINVNSGTPSASVSANIANSYAFLTGTGNLGTTNAQTLSLGGSGTGNITISPANGSGTLGLSVGGLTINNNTGQTSASLTCVSVTNGIVTGTGNCGAGQGGSVWTLNSTNGTLYPINNTLDLLLGGESTTSARFAALNIAGGTPTASVSAGSSGGAYLTAAGTLQTTAYQSLTLGGDTTGNISISAKNGNGLLGLKANTLTINGTTGVTSPSLTCVSITNGIVTGTGTCGAGQGGSVWTFNATDATLYPLNTTVDFIIGGVSTASAAFHIYGASDSQGTKPVATISANTAYAGLVVDNKGNGDLFTASSSGLTRFTINQNGTVTIPTYAGTNAALYANTTGILGTATTATSGQCLISGTSTPSWTSCSFAASDDWDTANGAIYPKITTQDLLLGGTSSSSAFFRVTGSSAFAGTTSVASIAANTSFAGLVVDNKGDGDLFTASKSGASKFTVLNNGNISWAGTSNFQNILNTNATAARTYTFPDASGTLCISGQTCATTGVVGYWQRNLGALSPANISDDLLIGGTSTSSATFHVYGSTFTQGTSPVASISANTSFAGMVVDNRGSGDLFTASSSGLSRFVITQNGNVGIGTTVPTAKFHVDADGPLGNDINLAGIEVNVVSKNAIISTNSADARFVLDNQNPSSSVALMGNYVGALTSTPGFLVGQHTTGTGFFHGLTNRSYNTYVGGFFNNWAHASSDPTGGSFIKLDAGNEVIDFSPSGGKMLGRFDLGSGAAGGRFIIRGDGTLTTGLATLDVRGDLSELGSQPVASISGRSGKAALMVDNMTDVGDLFTASSSGLTRFTVYQNGNIGIGSPTTASILSQSHVHIVDTLSAATAGTSNVSLFLQSNTNTDGTGSGLGFSTSTNASNLGGKIVFVRTGAQSQGDLAFYTKPDTTVGDTTTEKMRITSTGTVGINTTSPLGTLDIRPNTSNGGTLSIASVSGKTSFASLVADNSGVGDLFTASSSGLSRFVIKQNGNVGIGTDLPTALLTVNSSGSTFETSGGTLKLDRNSSCGSLINLWNQGTFYWDLKNSTNGCANLGTFNFVGADAGTKMSLTQTGRLGIGTDTTLPIATLDLRTTTATFPIASISGSTNAGFASLVVDNSGSGDLFTASSSGLTRFTINQNGTITAPNYAGNNAVFYAAPSTGLLTTASTSSPNLCLVSRDSPLTPVWSSCITGSLGFWTLSSPQGTLYPINATLDLLIGGTSTASAKFHVFGTTNNNGTQPVASVSANSSHAGLVVDNRVGDLFTASSSGLNRFVINQNGNVGIATASAFAKLDIKDTSSLSVAGSEKITDADDRAFTTSPFNWTTTGSPPWKIDVAGSNVAAKDAPGTGALTLPNTALDVQPFGGKVYQVTFDYLTTSTSSGTLTVSFGTTAGVPVGQDASSGETNVQIIRALSAGPLTFTPTELWYGTLDNISVKEVSPASMALRLQPSDGSTTSAEFRVGGSGLGNLFIGFNSGFVNTSTGLYNTGLGTNALSSNTTADYNSALGFESLYYNTTGTDNSAFGFQALKFNVTGIENSAFGSNALSQNLADRNSAFGASSLQANTTGAGNSAFGNNALLANTTGDNNSAFGASVLNANTTGSGNSAFGKNILLLNETGSNNSAFGLSSMQNSTAGSNNSAFGASSLNSVTGSYNSALGVSSMGNNTSGSNNSALGYRSLGANSSGENNVGVGFNAGFVNNGQFDNTTGSNNIYIGTNSGPWTNASGFTNSTAIGAYALVNASNSLVLGGTKETGYAVNVGIGTATPSATLDIRRNIATQPIASLSGATTFAGLLVDNSGSGDLFTASSSGLNRFVIKQNGNVGIGTTTPTVPLDVVGDIRMTGTSPDILAGNGNVTTEMNFNFPDVTNAEVNFRFFRNTPTTGNKLFTITVGNSTTAQHQFNAGTGEVTLARVAGNVGIGDTTPTEAKLVVGGDIYATFAAANSTALCWDNSGGSLITDCTGGPSADYAEIYSTATDVDYGDIVTLGAKNVAVNDQLVDKEGNVVKGNKNVEKELVKSTVAYDSKVIGIVSKNYGDFSSTGHGRINEEDHPMPITLSGRVPVKIASSSASIVAGDYITTSAEPGRGMKATHAGQVIGKALEEWSPQSGKDQILVFVNNFWYDPDIYLTSTGNISIFEKTGAPELEGASTFVVKDANGVEVVRNGIFSNAIVGNLKSGSLDVQQLTLGGTNINDRLLGIENLATSSANFTAPIIDLQNSISSLSDRVASLEANLSLTSLTSPTTPFVASSSADLSLYKLDAMETNTYDLSVLNRALFKDVGITGKVNMGLLLIDGFNENSYATINTTSGDLMLQSEGLNGIDILNGKVTIDTSGNISTVGNITAKKYNVDTKDVASASLGEGVIPLGQTKVVIQTKAVTKDSKIFITPTTKTSLPLAVTTQKDGESFTVEIDSPYTLSIKFNWWIVN